MGRYLRQGRTFSIGEELRSDSGEPRLRRCPVRDSAEGRSPETRPDRRGRRDRSGFDLLLHDHRIFPTAGGLVGARRLHGTLPSACFRDCGLAAAAAQLRLTLKSLPPQRILQYWLASSRIMAASRFYSW